MVRWSITYLALTALVALAACDEREPDGTVIRTADGIVALDSTETPVPAISYEVDSEDYQKWVVAQRALDAIPGFSIPTRVSLNRFTEDDLDDAADWLEEDERARAALESADMSAKDFVRTSVALEQLVATMSTTDAPRFRETAPRENVAFVDRQPEFRQAYDARRVRVVDDDHRRDANEVDSDSDRRGKGKADVRKRKDRGRGPDSDSR